jgi:hypothetical protein
MKKILTARLHSFRNEAHCEYMIVFRNRITKFPNVQSLLSTLYGPFVNLITKEEDLINAMRKSDYTKQIAEADQRVDRTVIGMRETVIASLHHFNPATVAAAQSLYNRFEAFGEITKKSYEEETLDVNLLIRDLNSSEYAAKAATLGLQLWIAELQAAETDFERLLDLRNVEYSQKPQERLKDLRREIDVAYHDMTDRITAAATLDTSNSYDAFIAQLNAEITYFNNHSHSHAHKDIGAGDACVVEPVAQQAYSGKAITPIPAAYYREEGKPTEELVFARDFSLTYKNNVDVGTADLILHGKGAYKGQKKITFTIARV